MPVRLTARVRRALAHDVAADAVSVGRALVLLAVAGTLLGAPPRQLVAPLSGPTDDAAALAEWHDAACHGLRIVTAHCLAPARLHHLALLAMAALLVVAAAGVRPRWLCIPAWWITWSSAEVLAIRDGGDSLAANLALLLVPVGLADRRWLAWGRSGRTTAPPPTGLLLARTALALAALQLAVVYLQAGVGKVPVAAWRAGTAVHDWAIDPTFGWRGPAEAFVPLLEHRPVVAALTWGSVALEFALAAGMLLPRPARRWLLVPGIALHGSIALLMGLTSLSLVMLGGLVLATWPLPRRTDGQTTPAPSAVWSVPCAADAGSSPPVAHDRAAPASSGREIR